MSEFVPTPTERIAAALERIADSLERINARQDAALRERYYEVHDNARSAEHGTAAWEARKRFRHTYRADIDRWTREDVEATQRLTASPSDDPNANRTAVSS